ncbi:S-adenosyl-L-methionine-dependent methyltransferase [Aspergillus avenaceus]|uniref:S-adenosyl-L-methionine-dependent methyltransferase n=1 Tax=Aspergillus avenaceus TaxID=36643 RepID=A0A5N6TGA7_ASPAV|nr:S-adenosyl-L-methionine-dependent methyltransferase [Aspergillus avenaceus]
MSQIDNVASDGHSEGHRKLKNAYEIALLPVGVNKIADLVNKVIPESKSSPLENMNARWRLRDAARSLANALETPREAIVRQCWSEPTIYAAIEVAIDLGIFALLARCARPMSDAEIASATETNPVLLARILKHLAATGIIGETGPDEYCSTSLSVQKNIATFSQSCNSRWFFPGIYALPTFLKETKYGDPSDTSKSAFKRGLETDRHLFELVRQNPLLAKQFSHLMSVYRRGKPDWMDKGFYPVRERLTEGVDIKGDDVLLVDVGGNTGNDLCQFKRKWPDVPGRLILQDLPEVVDAVKGLPASIEPMAYDFFTVQPVQGARAYYMHFIFHDWPDEICREILSNIIPAMTPGYSKILINEHIVPSTGAYCETTSLDMIMMTLGSRERTEDHWIKLLTSVGLKIVEIWSAQKGVESLIECELA